MGETIKLIELILKSDISLIAFMLLIIVIEGLVIRKLWLERQDTLEKYHVLVEAGHDVVKTVNEQLAAGNEALRKCVKAIALVAQDRLEGTGIDLRSLLDI